MRAAILVALLITGGAAFFYGRQLDLAPLYLHQDEVNFGIQAHAVATTGRDADGHRLPVYFEEPGYSVGRDPVYIYCAALALRVLPWTESTLRVPAVIAGLLSVFLVVVAGSELFGSVAAGAVAGIFLAVSPAFFIHSRQALCVIFTAPFVAAWLLFVLRYLRLNRSRELVFAMASLGLGIYTYIAMLVLVPVYALMTALIVVQQKRWKHLGVIAACMAVALLPLVAWQLSHANRISAAAAAYHVYDPKLDVLHGARDLASWFSVSTRADVYWQAFNPGRLFFSGESSLVSSTRQAGTFPLAFLVLLPLGTVAALRRPLSPGLLLILAGFITAPLPAMVVAEANVYRYLSIAIFATLLATAGVWWLWARPHLWSRGLAIGLVLSSVWMFQSFRAFYLSDWPAMSAVYFGGNIRGPIESITNGAETPDLIYLSSRVPYLERYFELYRRLHRRDDLRSRVRILDITARGWIDPSKRSVAIVAANDRDSIDALEAASWRAIQGFNDPDGHTSFLLFSSTPLTVESRP